MVDVIGIVKGLVGSFCACACFAMLFHMPRRCLLAASLTSMTGYGVYMLSLIALGSTVGASFIAALVVAFVAEWMARRQKAPAIIYSMMGLVPLVPGVGLYRTMLSLVLREYGQAAATGMETLLISAGLALAVAVVTILTRARGHADMR